MAAPSNGTMWDRGVGILNTKRDSTTNTMLVQLGDEYGTVTESNEAEFIQQIGFASCASKPTKGQPGPQATILRASDRDVCIATSDARCHPIYGSLTYGEFCIYAAGDDATGQVRIFGKADGSISLYTRVGNTSSGDGMIIQLDPVANTASVLNGMGFGMIADSTGVTITAGDAALRLNADGTITLIGKGQTQIDGTTIMLGSVGVPVVNAALHGATGVSGVASLKVLIE